VKDQYANMGTSKTISSFQPNWEHIGPFEMAAKKN